MLSKMFDPEITVFLQRKINQNGEGMIILFMRFGDNLFFDRLKKHGCSKHGAPA